MPTVKVRNTKNEEVGEVELSDAVFGAPLTARVAPPSIGASGGSSQQDGVVAAAGASTLT